MILTRDFVREVRKRLAEDMCINTATLAQELGYPEAYVIMAFPVAMRIRADNQSFDLLWNDLLEAHGTIGTQAHEHRDVVYSCTIKFIWFVSRSSSQEIQFFDADGNLRASILFTDTNEAHNRLNAWHFLRLKEKYGVVAKPPQRACSKNCRVAGCGGQKTLQAYGKNTQSLCG